MEQKLLAIPLRLAAKRVGVLVLACTEAWRPSPDEQLDLRALGNLLALALLRAQDQDAERQLRAKVEVITRASVAITDKLAILPETHLRAAVMREFRLWPSMRDESLPAFLQSVLQTIVEHAVAATGAQFGALGVGESPTKPFEPWVFSGVTEAQVAAVGRFPRPVGTLGVVAREGRVIRVPDVHAHPAFQGFPSGHPEMTSLLGVPIRYRGTSLGNLYLGNKVGAAEFTEDDEVVVGLLASQAALTLQQAYFHAAIDAQRAQLQIILDSAPHGLLFVDGRSREVVANARAMQLLGAPATSGVGTREYLRTIHRPDGRPLPEADLPSTRALMGQTVKDEELSIVSSDGRGRSILLSAAPVIGLDQKPLGVVVTFEDISAFKELERLREDFARIVAHDLRDPVQGIIFQSNLILRRGDGESVHVPVSLIRGIEKNARRLGQMTNDLLDAARVELHSIALDRKWVDVPGAVRELIEQIRPALSGHPVEVSSSPAIKQAWVDPLRFDQILTNLLDNAAKFSAEGSPISVHISTLDEGVEVSVRDRGIGISPEEMTRLFDRFYQARRARERKTGLGLGLYISKGLVEAHNGRLWVESEMGKGSVFHVWFPPKPEDAG
ncbi:MAG: ATP-binding protein [Myxococcota bacterium]